MTIEGGGLGAATLGGEDRAAALAAIKTFLRIETGGDDTVIAMFAETSLGLGEQFLGKVLIARAVTQVLPVRSGWQRLSASPVRAITGVAGLATDGVATALPPIDYAIDIDAGSDGWVRISDAGGAARVQVTATAGLASGWAALPPPIRQGVVVLAGYLFAEREETRPPPAAVTALWRPYRAIALHHPVHA